MAIRAIRLLGLCTLSSDIAGPVTVVLVTLMPCP